MAAPSWCSTLFFGNQRDPAQDEALAEAMRRQQHIVLMAEQAQVTHPTLAGAQPTLPSEPFLSAAGTNWGVAWLDPDLDSIVRRHWPFPSPGPYPSLPWTAARLAGAPLSEVPQERWLRYYGRDGACDQIELPVRADPTHKLFPRSDCIHRHGAENIGARRRNDKFRTPYTRWTGEATGGVEILLTSFLNLMNGDWLRRPAGWLEALMLVTSGLLLGGGLCRLRLPVACAVAAGVALVVTFGAISWSYFTNYWFPWLVIVGGQVPCALAWALVIRLRHALEKRTVLVSLSFPLRHFHRSCRMLPITIFSAPFGEGAYGKVTPTKATIRHSEGSSRLQTRTPTL